MSSLPLPRIVALAVMIVIGALAAITSPASASPRLTQFPLPEEFALPNSLTTGPDGAVWVTDSSLGRIWRIAGKGKISSYDLGRQPTGIVTAHDAM